MANESIIIAPSILSADLAHLQAEIDAVEPYADWLQIDVMDGHFVPNLSFGAPVMKWIQTKLLLDVHLMVTNPADRVKECIAAGAKNITFHAEAVSGNDRRALIQAIRKEGATAGIALNPQTPLSEIDDVIGDIDLLLIMSVNPGFGGQSFIASVLDKIREARKRFPQLMIQIDGGIDKDTARLAREAGANNLVAGAAIFSGPDRRAAIEALRS